MKLEKKHDLAVILINYNSYQYTINCVESIVTKTNSNLDYQIIITDNCSEESDYLSLKKYFENNKIKNLQLIRSNINTGFGGGNMLGVHYSNAKFLAFVNNDSIFTNDCLSIIIETMIKNPEMGICGPLCYKENMVLLPTIDHFGSPAKEFFGRSILEKINPVKYPNRKIIYDKPQRAQFVSGSFMVVKNDDFNKVGGFDTNIFLYYEETDLCKRLQKINKFAYLIPEAQFIHFHGGSTPNNPLIRIELKISYLYIIRKHYGFVWHKIILFKMQSQYFIKSFFKPRHWALFLVLMKGGSLAQSMKHKQMIVDLSS